MMKNLRFMNRSLMEEIMVSENILMRKIQTVSEKITDLLLEVF